MSKPFAWRPAGTWAWTCKRKGHRLVMRKFSGHYEIDVGNVTLTDRYKYRVEWKATEHIDVHMPKRWLARPALQGNSYILRSPEGIEWRISPTDHEERGNTHAVAAQIAAAMSMTKASARTTYLARLAGYVRRPAANARRR